MKSKYITDEEVKKIRKSMSEEAWLPFWVSLETGLRVGDVVKLRKENLKADGLHYKAQKTKKNGVAKISANLTAELKKKKGKWLFSSPYKPGKHITRQCVWARVKTACKRAGVELDGISPHAFRKVFAVELYREKGFTAVKEALQHSNSLTTEVYSFADWNTGENASKPLTRRDLQLVVRMVLEALGEGVTIKAENSKKGKKNKNKTEA